MYEENTQTTTPAETPSSGQDQPSKGMAVWSKPSSDGVPNQSERQSQQTTQTQQPTQPGANKPAEGQGAESREAQVNQLAQRSDVQAQAERQGIDVKELARNIVQAQLEANQQMEASKPKEYTEDQFRKDFGVVQVDDQQFEGLFGVEATPERVQAFNQIIKQTAVMAVKMSQFQTQQALSQIKEQINPLQSAMRKVENQAIERRFDNKYPQLRKHREFVSSVLARMKQSGKSFKSVDEAIDAAAKQSISMLQQAGVQLTPPQQNQQPAAQTRTAKQPGQLSMGGSVGATRSASPTQSLGKSVLKRSMTR